MIIKVNAITDDQMIRVLYRASQAGVSIDLIVRGICSLRPGIPGISDNIRSRRSSAASSSTPASSGSRTADRTRCYIGSADLMERNLDRRVETLVPVRDPEILEHLRDVVLDAYLKDTDRAMRPRFGGRTLERLTDLGRVGSTRSSRCCSTTPKPTNKTKK